MQEEFKTRPIALAPHFTVHRQGEDRLLLLSEDGSFRLRGQLYIQLLGFLDGRFTPNDIVGIFAASGTPEQLFEVLDGMLTKGYAISVTTAQDMNLHAYWTSQGETPMDARAKVAAVPVGVLGLGEGAVAGSEGAGVFAAQLTGSGFNVVSPEASDLVVVLVDDFLQAALVDLDKEFTAAGRSWVPVKLAGVRSWIGPRMGAGVPHTDHPQAITDDQRPCYHCLSRRLLSHRPGDTLLPATAHGMRPARAWTPGSLSLTRGFAITELLRQVRGETSDLDRHLLTLDTRDMDRATHLVPRFGDCPVCGSVAETAVTEAKPIVLNPVSTGGDGDGGWRALSAEEALNRLESIVSPLTGIVSRVHDKSLAPGLHIAVADQANREKVDPRENRRLGKPEAAGGKGLSPTQARVSCLAEAVERYACGWTGTEPRRLASFADLGDEAVHPGKVLGFSDHQYANRDTLNEGADGMHIIPQVFDENKTIEWTPAWSLTHNAPRWLPTRYCYYNYQAQGHEGDHQFCFGDSNGCASGGTLEEAILQGMLELIERDAISIWWYNRLSMPAADTSGVDARFMEAMYGYQEERGLNLEVLDLTSNLGIPVVTAISSRKSDGGAITLGFGAHLDPTVAATRALTELNQLLPFNESNEMGGEDTQFPAALTWYETAKLDDHPYLRVSADAAPASFAAGIGDVTSIDGAVQYCVDQLRAHGHELIVLDLDRSDVPLSCVRTVAPGICHFWNRRGAPRLFQAPVAAGRLDAPLSEDGLNPISFFV